MPHRTSESARHIALYLPALKGGGAERVMVRLANELATRGHRIELVLVSKHGEYLDDVSERVTIVDLDTSRFLVAVPALVRYLRSAHPEALLATIDAENVSAIIARSVANVDTRVVIRISNMMSAKETGEQKLQHRIVHAAAKRTYRHADHVIGVSTGVRDDVVTSFGVPPSRATAILNPVVSDKLRTGQTKPVDHPWLQPGCDQPVVVGAGELTTQKDFKTLLTAFANVDITPAPRLIILGEGDERERLENIAHLQGIADRVSLPGWIENPYAYMARANAFVLSSRWEGCPNVLIEAMACGTPLISTDCPSGPREILDDGTYGMLVPIGDSEAMSAAIRQILTGETVNTDALLRRAERFAIPAVTDDYSRILFGEDGRAP